MSKRASSLTSAAREAERAQLIEQRRANRRLRALLAGSAVLLVAAAAAGTVAIRARGTAVDEAERARTEQVRADEQAAAAAEAATEADEQAAAAAEAATEALAAARIADARRLIGQSAAFTTDPQLELLTAVEAVRREPLPSAHARLLGALARSPAVLLYVAPVTSIADLFPIPTLALLDNGHAAQLGGAGLRTWELSSDGTATKGGLFGDVPSTAGLVRTATGYLTADGSSLTSHDADGTPAGTLALAAPVHQLVGSPGGTRAAALLDSGEVVLVDATDSDLPGLVRSVRPAEPAVLDELASLAVADDGRLAVMAGATAYEWDAAGVALAPLTTAGTGWGLAFRGDDLVHAVGSEVLALADLPATDPTVGIVGEAASVTNPEAPSAPPDETDPVTAGSPLTSVDTGSGPRLSTSGTPGGGSRVALLDDTSIVWSDSSPDGSVSGDRLDPDLGLLHSLALSPDGRTAFVLGSRGFAARCP